VKTDMKICDVVKPSAGYPDYPSKCGVILEIDINMWGEETEPTGIKVLWSSGEVETVYSDELEIVDINKLKEEIW